MITKKLVVAIFAIISTGSAFGQDKVGDYFSTYYQKKYDIEVAQDETDTSKYKYYIDCQSADRLSKDASIDISSYNLPDFISFLNSVKDTYAKWNETAKANNVTELEKDIDGKSFRGQAAFYFGDWNFDYNVLYTARVKIIGGKMVLIIDSDELEASDNEFIKSDGLRLIFSSPAEVDEFINKIDINKVRSFFVKKNKTHDLFKN